MLLSLIVLVDKPYSLATMFFQCNFLGIKKFICREGLPIERWIESPRKISSNVLKSISCKDKNGKKISSKLIEKYLVTLRNSTPTTYLHCANNVHVGKREGTP